MNTALVDNDLASIRQELNVLRAEMAALRKNGHGNHNGFDVLAEPALTDRRGMMKKMAGLAVGVATVGLLRPSSSKAGGRTPNTSGGNFILGVTNDANSPTTVINSSPDLISRQLVGANYGDVFFVQPAGTSIGVLGYTDTAGATSGGSNDLFGVYGHATGGGFATGVFGDGDNIGVSGVGGAGGCGCDGVSDGESFSYGIRGRSDIGVGGNFQGGTAAIGTDIGSGAVADPNVTSPSGKAGDFYRGSANGSMWYRAGGIGSYRRVADSTTAGALTAFAAGAVFVNITLTANQVKAIQIGGTTVGANAVPAKARAVIGRIANPNSNATGTLLVAGANPPPAGTGVIAVVPDASENSFFLSALDDTGKLYVKANFPSGTTGLVIIISGYYE